jgi:hypothetical protein
MTAGQLRTIVLEAVTMSDKIVQRAFQKDLKLSSRMAALKLMWTDKIKKKRLVSSKNKRTGLRQTGRK